MNSLANFTSVSENYNPTIKAPESAFDISFFQTKDSLSDAEVYRNFLKNAERRFRTSKFYKHYKGNLMEMGLNKSQMLGNVTAEMIGDQNLHMHHYPIGLFSICVIITEHMLNTNNKITTFDLVNLVRKEHELYNVGVCFLDVTSHSLYHNTDQIYISPKMIVGKWWNLLKRYPLGLTQDIAFKLLFWIKTSLDKGDNTKDGNLLLARDKILEWNKYNNQLV